MLGEAQRSLTQPREPRRGPAVLVAAAVVIGALSLIVSPHGVAAVSYDPMEWLIWGREVIHLDLVTTAGPSWKPLPVLFTAPFSAFGDAVAPTLWLVVARTGGILGLLLAYRVAARVAGRLGGVIAVAALARELNYVVDGERGETEALMVALALLAIDLGFSGRHRRAFLAGTAAALLRPEAWPFVAAYGLWLLARDRRTPEWRRTLALVLGAGVVVLALWFVPEKLGSGHWLRGAQRAQDAVPGSPAQAAFPFGAVFTNSASTLIWPVYVGAVAGALLALADFARRRTLSIPLVLTIIATGYIVIVAALAQGPGFTGNQRYVIPAAGWLAVLAGIGWARAMPRLLGALWRPAPIVVAVAVLAAGATAIGHAARRLYDQQGNARAVVRLYADLPYAIERAGGAAYLRSCAPLFSGPFQTPIVAWRLHLHQYQVGLHPRGQGTLIAPSYNALATDRRYRELANDGRWVIRTACPPRAR
jgi:hypothetical protein